MLQCDTIATQEYRFAMQVVNTGSHYNNNINNSLTDKTNPVEFTVAVVLMLSTFIRIIVNILCSDFCADD